MEGQRADTHPLERRGHGVSAGAKQSDLRAGTHILESRGHSVSAGTKQSDQGQTLTN
jgi:hypothetical protein